MYEIRTFRPGDEAAFYELNRLWVEELFVLEEKDREVLSHPAKYILEPGGQIFMAVDGDQSVGCVALIPMADGSFEIGKMTVASQCRGKGLGRKLLLHAIAYARHHQIPRLYLETNEKLHDAIHLYESVGFLRLSPHQVQPSPYARANVYMALPLNINSPNDLLVQTG